MRTATARAITALALAAGLVAALVGGTPANASTARPAAHGTTAQNHTGTRSHEAPLDWWW